MSSDELRRLLNYRDDAALPSLPGILARAHRRQRRQRLTAAGVAVLILVATLGALSTWKRPWSDGSIPATPPSGLQLDGVAGLRNVPLGTSVHFPHGWSASLKASGTICWRRSATPTGSRPARRICRTLTQLAAGGPLQTLVLEAGERGAVYTGLAPWMASKVQLRTAGAVHDADFVGFAGAGPWALWAIWLPVRDRSATVVVFDPCGQPHTTAPDPEQDVCGAPPRS